MARSKPSKRLFCIFMDNALNTSGDAGRGLAAEDRNYASAHSRIQRRAQPLLKILQAVGLDVSRESADNRSTVTGRSAVVCAHIRHADMMLPECHIILSSTPRTNKNASKDTSSEDDAYMDRLNRQTLKIIIKPSSYGLITEDQTRRKNPRTERTVFTIPQATAALKVYLLSTLPDQCGNILGAQPPTLRH